MLKAFTFTGSPSPDEAGYGAVRIAPGRRWSVLILSRHATQAASSRLRTGQYVEALRSLGADVTFAPFFDASYLRRLYETGGRAVSGVMGAYVRRALALRNLRRASVVWIEKEMFPFLPGIFESLPRRMRVPYVVDYDDATFHTYDRNRNPFLRALLARKLDGLLAGAHAVTAGSAYLERYAREHGARNVARIPTVVDPDRYPVLAEPAHGEIRIGWIGTPETTRYLRQLKEPLCAAAIPLRLVTVGAGEVGDLGVPLEQHPWSAATEAELLSTLHIGVMPLPDEPWERGKCGYKLIQYMAAGRPVIASPVGANVEIVTPETGILAADAGSWAAALRTLAQDADLRRRMGAQGRARVEAHYSLRATAPKFCAILASAAGAD
ncbi:MAG TPA: glycosyltransferase family 4 protein [Rhizomicrobium sp.]|nr:glycosyltransferase family 4 protein [Rhizomicrobium sp.]